MFRRPYTCIFSISDGSSSACIVDAPDGADKALEAAKEALPDASVIHAMIPGIHDGHTYTYKKNIDKDTRNAHITHKHNAHKHGQRKITTRMEVELDLSSYHPLNHDENDVENSMN